MFQGDPGSLAKQAICQPNRPTGKPIVVPDARLLTGGAGLHGEDHIRRWCAGPQRRDDRKVNDVGLQERPVLRRSFRPFTP